jgi:serine/threonine protein kinase
MASFINILFVSIMICGYQILEEIGKGASSVYYCEVLQVLMDRVKLAYNGKQQQYAAMKLLPVAMNREGSKAIAREIQIHRSLHHQNVIRFLLATEDVDYIYIAMEYAALGELFNYISPDIGIENDLVQLYFVQLCAGLVLILLQVQSRSSD